MRLVSSSSPATRLVEVDLVPRPCAKGPYFNNIHRTRIAVECGFELVYHKKYMGFLSWITELPQGDAVPAQQDLDFGVQFRTRLQGLGPTDQGFWFRSKGARGLHPTRLDNNARMGWANTPHSRHDGGQQQI